MKIAVIGGGITGLTAACRLSDHGHNVTVFERESYLGGLAWGFKEPGWDWYLEAAYHHLFTNDTAILSFMDNLGLSDKIIISRPITSNYWNGSQHQFDSPKHLLAFPGLSMTDKLRTGFVAVFCKAYPFWKTLESTTAKSFFTALGGKQAWNIIWEPLMRGKFGQYDSQITASWLWARVHKRTASLCYIEGGFQTFVSALAAQITSNGGIIKTSQPISAITLRNSGASTSRTIDEKYCKTCGRLQITVGKKRETFDRVLITTPTPIAAALSKDLAKFYSILGDFSPLSIPHLHAQTLILVTKRPILNNTYWLSVTDRSFPFLAVVAHTNFMDRKYYGGNHITYIGNYLPPGHTYLHKSAKSLLGLFMPYLQKLNPDFSASSVIKSIVCTGLFAQPVHLTGYSQRAPQLTTVIPGVYLANMDSIYPWDRGTNYAVELGFRAADSIHGS